MAGIYLLNFEQIFARNVFTAVINRLADKMLLF